MTKKIFKSENAELINLTPHKINLYAKNSVIKEIEPEPLKEVLRAEVEKEIIGEINGLPVYSNRYKVNAAIIPPPKDNVYYIVSKIFAEGIKEVAPDRKDFIIVNDTIRNAEGQIIGCRNFAMV